MSDIKYYASYNTSVSESAPVAGWYDSSVQTWPDYSKGFIEITADQYANRNNGLFAVSNGKLISIAVPDIVQTLGQQANIALASARTTVYNNYGILNEATPDEWVTYIKALMAIVNGTDTTSTILPTQPTD